MPNLRKVGQYKCDCYREGINIPTVFQNSQYKLWVIVTWLKTNTKHYNQGPERCGFPADYVCVLKIKIHNSALKKYIVINSA